ncbi:NAD(P)-binding protein [Trametopsis cervina]|nr:NAD(P)-binding protein [Trametopsis cervina]
MSDKIVVVTGASGFIGGHIVYKAVAEGYRVRAVARVKKVADTKERFASAGDKVEVFGVDDIINGSFKEVLTGAWGVIHAASPLPGKGTHEEVVNAGRGGATNIFNQAIELGIKNLVLISSMSSVKPPGFQNTKLTEKDWNPITWEQATGPDASPFAAYDGSKALAEKAVWEIVEKHPDVEFAAVLPVFNLGPFPTGTKIAPHDYNSFSTNVLIGWLFFNQIPMAWNHEIVDVRDVAAVAVASLTAPPTSKVGRKRFPVASDHWPNSNEVVEYVSSVRPQLKDAFTAESKSQPPPPEHYFDTSFTKQTLGVKFTPWTETVVDAVDSVIATQKSWE